MAAAGLCLAPILAVPAAAHADLNYRNKQLSRRYLPGSETGIRGLETMAPPGVVSGQKIKLFFNHLVRADSGERELQNLPLQVSMIATDIGTGERVVLREGSVTQAMRASMSVPGLMAPLDYRGRKLVDGGLVDNLPIAEVRERCKAEVVIAVNVGSRPLAPEKIGGLLSIAEQAIALLTEQNVQASLALLRPADVFIEPELGSITSSDFARHAEAAQRGREAAETLAPRLQLLALDEAAYARWRKSVAVGERAAPTVDEVQIAELDRVNRLVGSAESISATVDATSKLARPASRVRRWLVPERGLHAARPARPQGAAPAAGGKELGPGLCAPGRTSGIQPQPGVQLRAARGLPEDLAQPAGRRVAGHRRTGHHHRAGSGTAPAAGRGAARFRGRQGHLLPSASSRITMANVEQRIAEYRRASAGGEISAGLNFSLLGQARLGWRETRITNELETGVDIAELLNGGRTTRSGGWLLALDLDQFDRLYFPRRGWAVNAGLYGNERDDYSRLDLQAQAAWPWQSWVLGTRASWVDSPQGQLPFNEGDHYHRNEPIQLYAPGPIGVDNSGSWPASWAASSTSAPMPGASWWAMAWPTVMCAPNASSATCRWACAATCGWAWHWKPAAWPGPSRCRSATAG